MNQQKNQGQRDGNQSQSPNRDQAERQRQQMPGGDPSGQRQTQDPDDDRDNQESSRNPNSQGDRGQVTPERGRGTPGGRNSSSGSGISNRGLNSDEEQEDVPLRGSERQPGDSER
jgi:hypothetical protein